MKAQAIFILVLLAVHTFAQDNRSYTLYKQCNSAWGNQALGNSGGNTICSAGCLMSCVAMILNTYGKTISGAATNPGNLNTWLKNNGGYAQGDLFVWASVSKLGLNFYGFGTQSNCRSQFDSGKNVILNVRNGGHWVLMNGYSGTTLTVNDPGFSVSSYALTDVVKTGVYNAVAATVLEQLFDSLKKY
jgi:ABC-type bacteriocin/lantibiotic exporter with double-glycine peptidase domain